MWSKVRLLLPSGRMPRTVTNEPPEVASQGDVDGSLTSKVEGVTGASGRGHVLVVA